MSWLSEAAKLLLPPPPERESVIVTRVSEAVDVGDTVDYDDPLYRRMTATERDLNPVTQDRAREVSHYLWRQNPFAKRLVEMVLDQVIGDEVSFEANEEDVQEVIDEFWSDPAMDLNLNFRGLLRDMSLDGELVLRAFEGNAGRIQIGYIDAGRVKSVHKDPENALRDSSIVLKPKTPGEDDEKLEVIQISRQTTGRGENRRLKRTYKGDTFFWAVNRPTAGTRGTPDLLAVADWIDGHDQILFNALDRTALQNAFVWDVELVGADEKRITEWTALHGEAPRPGAVRVHNDGEKWSTVTPSLGAAETEVVARLIKNLVLGSTGIPEAWFAEGDSANRATLAEQGSPTYKMIRARQALVRAMLTRILEYVVDKAVASGRVTSTDLGFSVNLPEPSSDDTTALATALPNLTKAISEAIDQKLISRQSARQVFLMVAAQLGIELDPTGEADQIEEEEKDDLAATLAVPPVEPGAANGFAAMGATQAIAAGKRPSAPKPAQQVAQARQAAAAAANEEKAALNGKN
jgi:hypothetical protein